MKVFLRKGKKRSLQCGIGTIEEGNGAFFSLKEAEASLGKGSVCPEKGETKGGKQTYRPGKVVVWEGCAKGYRREA